MVDAETLPPRSAAQLVLVALLMATCTFLWLLPGLDEVGITWDEPKYFDSTEQIQGWLSQALHGHGGLSHYSAATVEAAWDPPETHYWNHHPPFYKAVMAVTEGLLGSVVGPIMGYRLAPLLWFSLLVAMVVVAAGAAWGRTGGVGAGLALMLLPRAVGHAHIAATDMPITAAWFLATIGAAAWLHTGRRWFAVAGIAGLGIGLATKFTAWLIPMPLLAWLSVVLVTPARSDEHEGSTADRWRLALSRTILWGAGGLVLGWFLTPPAWHHPIDFVVRLFSESLDRANLIPVSVLYFGKVYRYYLPWHQSVVMTLITTPVTILGLAIAGAVAGLRRSRSDRLTTLAVIQIVFFLTLMALPSSPNHDGIRQFLAMLPFTALLAGRGLAALARSTEGRLDSRSYLLVLLIATTAIYYPAYLSLHRIAPFYLSYYNILIGGLQGAEDRGMETTYWYDSVTPELLEGISSTLPRGARLLTFPTAEHFVELQRYHQLRADLVIVSEPPADYYLQVARLAGYGPWHWQVHRHGVAIHSARCQGVLLAGLYRFQP